MRRLLLVFLLLLPTTVGAANYYFSDCATGGAGTIGDPYCVDPDSDGINESMEVLFDGTGAEAAAGDFIYFCAGACNGTGSGTYYLETDGTTDGDGNTYVMDLDTGGTAGNPITFTVYCDGSNCENVTLSGDHDADGTAELTGPLHFISFHSGTRFGHHYISWLGNPNNDGTKDLIIQKFIRAIFSLNKGSGGSPGDGPDGWIIDGLELWGTAGAGVKGQALWDGGSPADTNPGSCSTSGCACDQFGGSGSEGWAVKASDINTTFTVKNNKIHHICVGAFRLNNNPSADAILIDNNTVYAMAWTTTGDFNVTNLTYSNNTISDANCIHIESPAYNIIIEGNTCSCPGTYPVQNPNHRRCNGMWISQGDIGANEDEVANVTVRRNRIFGLAVDGGEDYGDTGAAFVWEAECVTASGCTGNQSDPGYLLENNIFYNADTQDGPTDTVQINTADPVTVQNNTIYMTGQHGIAVLQGSGHIIKNNVMVNARGTDYEYRVVSGSATTTYNQFHYGESANNVASPGGATCGDGVCTCAEINAGDLGTGNRCNACKFLVCDSATFCTTVNADPATWDFHLDPTDTNCMDVGTTGASEDYDEEARSGSIDIGADEYVAGGGGGSQRTVINGRITMSGRCVIQ